MADEKVIDYIHHRPAYHIVPQHGWMGDPDGTVFYQGRYHIFYQLNPDDMVCLVSGVKRLRVSPLD